MKIYKKALKIVIFLIITHLLNAEYFSFNYTSEDKYQLTVKGNIKIYINDKYKGLNIREIKGILNVKNKDKTTSLINGKVYYYRKTIRGNSLIGFEIDRFEDCSFKLNSNGTITSNNNSNFPPITDIPYFPVNELKIGDTYKSYGKANINLYNSNSIDSINFTAVTKYSGKKEYLGSEVDLFEISYRYDDIAVSNEIKMARGTHNLLLYYSNLAGKPIFMKDSFTEEFELVNGNKIRQDGFYLYFYESIIPMDKKDVVDKIKKDLKDDEILKDLNFSEKEEGISLTINNLKFRANTSELLNSESTKLKSLLETLKKIEGRSFMIIGHTALAGTEDERMKLSIERARTIAEYLSDNGIDKDRIFFAGKGANEPVATNDTEANMQKNRRVEIIILED